MDNPPSDGPCEVTITAPDHEWLKAFVHQLVEDRIAAAGHIDAMDTTYRWREELQSGKEARARLHTRFGRVPEIVKRARDQHEFEMPCVVATPIDAGDDRYISWIVDNSTPRNAINGGRSSSLLSRVHKWINGSGFPLEMRVARAMRRLHPTRLGQEEKYRDAHSDVIRPIDVIAIWSQLPSRRPIMLHVTFCVAVECKSGSTPWIAFLDQLDQHTQWPDFNVAMLAASLSERERDDVYLHVVESIRRRKASLLKGDYSLAYALQQMKGAPRERVTDEKNEAFDALRQAASGAEGVLSKFSHEGDTPKCTLAMPVLVTTHPLFTAQLQDSGDVKIEPVDRVAVPVTLGFNDRQTQQLVHVVHEDVLDEFLLRLSEVADSFMAVPQRGGWDMGLPDKPE